MSQTAQQFLVTEDTIDPFFPALCRSCGRADTSTQLNAFSVRHSGEEHTLVVAQGCFHGRKRERNGGDPARTAISANPSRLPNADLAYAEARRTSEALLRLVQSGRGSEQDVSAYQTAAQSLETATAERAAALSALRTDGTEGMAGTLVQRIARIHANRHWQVPIEFQVIDRTEQEWVALMEALANEHVAAKGEGSLDPAMQSQLASWRQNAEVVLARTNRDANLAAIQTAWNSAVGQ